MGSIVSPLKRVYVFLGTRSLGFIIFSRALVTQRNDSVQFSSVQSLSHVRLFVTPWTAARQASLSIANSHSLLKLMSIESVMPSSHLILCRPLLLLPSVFPSIRVFSNESVLHIRWPKYWSFSFGIRVRPRHVSMNKSYRFLTWREPGAGGKGGGFGG